MVPRLAAFLAELPGEHAYAVELPHEAYFADTVAARELLGCCASAASTS